MDLGEIISWLSERGVRFPEAWDMATRAADTGDAECRRLALVITHDGALFNAL